MASANLSVKNITATAPLNPAQGGGSNPLLALKTGSGDFGSVLSKTQSAAAPERTSTDKALPLEGKELPSRNRIEPSSNADEISTNSASKADQEASFSETKQSSGSEAEGVEAQASDTNNVSSENSETENQDSAQASAGETESNQKDDQSQTEEAADQANSGTGSEEGETQTLDDEVIASSVADAALTEAELAAQAAAAAQATDQVSPDGQQIANAQEGGDNETTEQVQPSLVNGQAGRQAGESDGRYDRGIGPDGVPPGVANASPRGLERGAAFNRGGEASQAPSEPVVQSANQQQPSLNSETVASTAPSGETEIEAPVLTTTVDDQAGKIVTPEGSESLVQTSDPDEPSLFVAPVGSDASTEEVSDPGTATQSTENSRAANTDMGLPDQTALTEDSLPSQGETSGKPAEVASAVSAPINTPTQQAVTPAGSESAMPKNNAAQGIQVNVGDSGSQQSKTGSDGQAAQATGDANRPAAQTASQTAATAGAFATELNKLSNQAQQTVQNPAFSRAYDRMQQPQWGQRLGERAIMMAQQGPRLAFVQLDPPELGSLQVRIQVQPGDQVSVNFTAPNATVKETLEQHLPRLREMFNEQGLNLAQSDVKDQSAGDGRERGEDTQRSGGNYGGVDEDIPMNERAMERVGLINVSV